MSAELLPLLLPPSLVLPSTKDHTLHSDKRPKFNCQCGSGARGIGRTWQLARNAESQAPPRPAETLLLIECWVLGVPGTCKK